MYTEIETRIESLGTCTIDSPLRYLRQIDDSDRIVVEHHHVPLAESFKRGRPVSAFEKAGPRRRIYFDPANVRAAIVTCGGLCPGLNDVIRSIVHELWFVYGVRSIKGVRFGYAGLNPESGFSLLELTPDSVHGIHEDGGTFLGSSRGPQPVEVMVDTLRREEIRILFTIGGDGTLRGASALNREIQRRGLDIAVVGVPKTIDNDISLVSRTFGFDTAVGEAVESLRSAHVEARAAINGIGIVKLMGRHSGFIAANAALAHADTDFVLIPEVPFDLEGPHGLLAALQRRLEREGHAVVVAAEGAGQFLLPDPGGTDASGNPKLGDVGPLLKGRITEFLDRAGIRHAVRYIDPSYIIRSVPANPNDCIFCVFLGQQAAHAGMAGKTGLLVGRWNGQFVHVPIESATRQRKQVDPEGMLWLSVLESTGQPERMVAPQPS